VAGFVVLLIAPSADRAWEQHSAHFWLVLSTALVNVVLGLAASEAARRRQDARATLVSLAFLSSAGFLALHAVATPSELVHGKNVGFEIATPVGLTLAAVFAAASALDLSEGRAAAVIRAEAYLRGALFLTMGVWATVTISDAPPFDHALTPEDVRGELLAAAVVGGALYGFAALRYP